MARRLVSPAALAVALLAISEWLADVRTGYLALAIVATAIAAVATPRRRDSRWSLGACVLVLAIACMFAARAELRLERFSKAPNEVGNAEAATQRLRLQAAVDAEFRALRSTLLASRGLSGPAASVVSRLSASIGDVEHRSVLIIRGDTLVAWAGTLHADPALLRDSSGVVASPFGLTLYAQAWNGAERVVATSLLYTPSPADRLAKGLSQRLPSDEVTEGFIFAPPGEVASADELVYRDGQHELFHARAITPGVEEVRFRMLERARVRVGLALCLAVVAFLIAASRRGGGVLAIAGGGAVLLACMALVPLSEFSIRSRMFDPSVYYFPPGGPFTSNAAALVASSAVLLLMVLLAIRRVGNGLTRSAAVAITALAIVGGPFAIRALSRGISPPADGATFELWLIWNIPLCLAATALLVLARWSGRQAFQMSRGVPVWGAPVLAFVAASLAPVLWEAPAQWPKWYALLWIACMVALVASRASRRTLRVCAIVAALASTTVVWGSSVTRRIELAERDVKALVSPDAYAVTLAERLARRIQGQEIPQNAQTWLERYVTSDLASAGYPVVLQSWNDLTPFATFGSGPFEVAFDTVGMIGQRAALEQKLVTGTTRAGAYSVYVVAFPMHGGIATIVVAPKTRLIGSDAYSRWYGLASRESNEPPYTLQVIGGGIAADDGTMHWRREGNELHGDWPVMGAAGPARAHAEVDLRGLGSLLPRGGLLVLIDLLAVSCVWVLAATGDGRIARWLRLRRREIESYRTRLSVALFLFFLVPAAVFAVWSWRQLVDDALSSRRLLVMETMRAFSDDPSQEVVLRREATKLDTKLLLYKSGVLVGASDPLFADLSPMGRLLRPEIALLLGVGQEGNATMPEPLDGAQGMLGYRVLPYETGRYILAAPARVDDLLLDRRRRDLGVLVLFASALGAGAALWLSGIAAQQLARPIGALRAAAVAVARGERELPLETREAREFVPVFTAFRAMAHDLGESQAALLEAQRRTDAVLRTVASGVIAVDERRCVILANPRADVLSGKVPAPGQPIAELRFTEIARRVEAFLGDEAERADFEVNRGDRTLRGQLTRLSRGGAVLTLDDVTDLARAQRVLAWGEMARQVAHEIKNPLTPIRLGVQHLLRAHGRENFSEVLETNVQRILAEIDRLDEIAKSFSRYGGAPAERQVAESVNVVSIVSDVVRLETLGEGEVTWRCDVRGEVSRACAREDELREVLLNLFENARHASATSVEAVVSQGAECVVIEVIDDGTGISAEILPRIFEPHFSTSTSGSGLGLAITRRMVESWGGSVEIRPGDSRGTIVRLELVPG